MEGEERQENKRVVFLRRGGGRVRERDRPGVVKAGEAKARQQRQPSNSWFGANRTVPL